MSLPKTIITTAILLIGAAASASLSRLHPAVSEPPRTPAIGRPGIRKVQAEETRHNFGMLDLGQTGEHWFTIRNSGDADLKLRVASTTCRCIFGELDRGSAPPGGEARVRLQWQPPKATDLFIQGATIKTNDPQQPSLHFSVVGQVRAFFAAASESIVLGELSQRRTARRTFVVYSQAWDDFGLETSLAGSAAGVSVELEPASRADLESLDALSGYRVHVEVAGQVETGENQVNLHLNALGCRTDGAEMHRELEVPIHWTVSGPVQVVGKDLRDGVLRLGTIGLGHRKQHVLYLLVRGEHQDLQMEQIAARPDFIAVQLGPRQDVSPDLARYPLHIEIPATAGPTAAVGSKQGEIRLKTNHAEAREISISVDLAIIERS